MSIENRGAVGRQLRTLFNVGAIRDLTDGQLLERFATGRGEAAELAFAALVERHGPMVLRVARGVLDDPHDIQDTFQATFLVLVTKARTLWVRDSLGPWLHQVAYRTSSSVRASAARRRRLDRRAAESRPEARTEGSSDEGRVLHEEIDRLPERFRAPVILCDLEGRTHEQAARHLGWPVGTVKSRQARARERLRDRLLRRGIAPGVGVLAASTSLEASLSSPLVESTTVAAVRFVASRAIVPGSAAALAQGVVRSMILTRWLKAASIVLALGATGTGVGLLAQDGKPGEAPKPEIAAQAKPADAPKSAPVQPGPLVFKAIERGYVEPAKAMDVVNEVEGNTVIISIRPDGSMVKKGEVIAELDSATLRDTLVNQRITTQQAEAACKQSRLVREVAEFTVKEFLEGSFLQDRAKLRGNIAIAKLKIEDGEARLERTRRARKQLDNAIAPRREALTPSDIMADLTIDDRIDEASFNLKQGQFDFELAQTELDVLEKFTKDKMTRQLTIDVERAKADELSKLSKWDLEKTKEKKLERQIVRCTLPAPGDGVLVYANAPIPGRPTPMIEEGATVRERQKLFRIINLADPMRINAKVHESLVDQVLPGMPAQIRIDAFPDQTFSGKVQVVSPMADPGNQPDGRKVYTTFVSLDQNNGQLSLRPGMSAQVEIVLKALENVIRVPVSSVFKMEGKDHVVAIQAPGDQFELRAVTLGVSNGEVVEVKTGLKPDEQVLLEPFDELTPEMKRKLTPKPTRTPIDPTSPR